MADGGDNTSKRPAPADAVHEDPKSGQQGAFEGANHPFAMPPDKATVSAQSKVDGSDLTPPNGADKPPTGASTNPDLKNAVELVKDAAGKITEKPLSDDKLSAGDHKIQLGDGRQFVMHIPENASDKPLPVVFVFTGSIENAAVSGTRQKTPEDFIQETGMNQAADKNNFIAVYPMPEFHKLGAGSKLPAYAWNAEGAGIAKEDVKLAGYDDLSFVKSVANALPDLANVDSTHKDWGAIGFSQGGIFLNDIAHKIPDLFPTVGLVGTTIENGQDNSTAPGNAKNVMIVNLRGDKSTLPFNGLVNESLTYQKNQAEINALTAFKSVELGSVEKGSYAARQVAEGIDPLGGIESFNINPYGQQELYTKELAAKGPDTTTKTELDTGVTTHDVPPPGLATLFSPPPQIDLGVPIDPTNKVTETIIKPKDANNDGEVKVFDLWTAQHAYPGPDRGAQINNSPKNPFDTTAAFAKDFVDFNEAEKKNQN